MWKRFEDWFDDSPYFQLLVLAVGLLFVTFAALFVLGLLMKPAADADKKKKEDMQTCIAACPDLLCVKKCEVICDCEKTDTRYIYTPPPVIIGK
jgi:hypothetical protein